MGVELKVSWLKEFINKVSNKWEVTIALNIGIKKSLFFLEAEAKTFTPVDTWVLRNSYRESFWNLTWKIFNFRKYSIFVHEGTRFIKSNPFMTKTVEKAWKEVELIMNDELKWNLSLLK